ncbi:MAG: hypothetical protein K6E26_02270 [Clostridiales bacterium]|nr:hypothetical protein [Clostridiales bacterium]
MKGSMKKYISLAKALVTVLSLCVVLSCVISPTRAEFEYQPVTAEIPFTCTVTGSADVDFEFVIQRMGDNCPVPKQDVVTIHGSGTAKFEVLLDEPGTYQYKVYEKTGDNKTIIYDEMVYLVTLFVTNDDEGNLEYQVILEKEGNVKPTEVAFVNEAVRDPKRKDPIVKTGDKRETPDGIAYAFIMTGASLLLLASIKRKETEYEE